LLKEHEKQTAPMAIHLALLRAVNVGGRQPILMAELRKGTARKAFRFSPSNGKRTLCSPVARDHEI
jgi:hypothetical protein